MSGKRQAIHIRVKQEFLDKLDSYLEMVNADDPHDRPKLTRSRLMRNLVERAIDTEMRRQHIARIREEFMEVNDG